MKSALTFLWLSAVTAWAITPFGVGDIGTPPFMPALETGGGIGTCLVARYQPYRVMQATFNGAVNVSQLNDTSGNGHHLTNATAAAQPYITNTLATGLYSLYFNGSSHFLKTPTFSLDQPATVVMSIKPVTSTTADRLFDGYSPNTGSVRQGDGTGTIGITANGTSTPVADNTDLGTGTFKALTVGFNGASSYIKVNLLTPTTGDAGTNSMSGMSLMVYGSGLVAWANSEVVEVLLFKRTITTSETAYNAQSLGRLTRTALW